MPIDFAALGVPEELTRSLAARGLVTPFPVQAATIPDGLAGRDLCGRAPTGSGKTIAFGIPLVLRVRRSRPKHPKGLVLVPTRELANQVADELRALAGDAQRIHAIYGGVGFEGQLKALRRGVDIVVACPGRLGDLIEKGVCRLDEVEMAVVDEADRMADMGFLPDVKRLLDQTAADRQTLLFSATLDGAIDELVTRYQRDPVRHEMPEDDTDQGHVDHHFWQSERPARVALTADIVRRTGATIVFCRTRHGADRVAQQLGRAGVRAAAIHGARSQSQRERALESFHRGEVVALVATDVAARGIHVTGVRCVVHFDLPADPKDYVHRSGRTARAGADGVVVSLVGAAERKDAARLRRVLDVEGSTTAPATETLPGARPTPPDAPEPMPAQASTTPVVERADRPVRRATSFPPEAERRDRPGPEKRPRRTRAPERTTRDRHASPAMKLGADSRGASVPPTQAAPKSGRTDGPAGTIAGAGKVRPSGAARRKAKRANGVEDGTAPPKAKGRAGRGSRSRSLERTTGR